MSDAVAIERFLAQEGYTTACARRQARTLLERAGLTRPLPPAPLPRAGEGCPKGGVRAGLRFAASVR